MSATWLLLLLLVLGLTWYGNRTARQILASQQARQNRLALRVLAWVPLMSWLLALLTTFAERKP